MKNPETLPDITNKDKKYKCIITILIFFLLIFIILSIIFISLYISKKNKIKRWAEERRIIL
jgi:flagellar basal body-associated protein FliL